MGWTASEDNDKRTYVTYRIYASNQYPVDIQKAENLVANGVRKTEFLSSRKYRGTSGPIGQLPLLTVTAMKVKYWN